MLNKNINNSGLFKKNKNTSARDMLSNMAGIRKPTGILAGSSELMQAVAMPQRQTGQGEIVTGALPGQFGPAPMKQPVPRPQPMNMNEQRMNMAQGPVPGMPNVQTDFAIGGVISAGKGLANVGSKLASLGSKLKPNMDVSRRAGSVVDEALQSASDDLASLKAQFSGKNLGKALIPNNKKGFGAGKEGYKDYVKVGSILAAYGLAPELSSPFTKSEFGDKADNLNKEFNETAQVAINAGNSEEGAKALIARMGGDPNGDIKEELNKIYGTVTGGKKIPKAVSKSDKIEGSIQAIIGGAAMSARGGFSARLAKGLEAGAKARLRLAEVEASKKPSEYTRQRAYDRILETLVQGAMTQQTPLTPAAVEDLKRQAATLAGAVAPEGGPTVSNTNEADLNDKQKRLLALARTELKDENTDRAQVVAYLEKEGIVGLV